MIEYRKLVNQKRKLEQALRLVLAKKANNHYEKNSLLALAKLNLKGGPRDLSARLNSFLYAK